VRKRVTIVGEVSEPRFQRVEVGSKVHREGCPDLCIVLAQPDAPRLD
jgi:hypothetical protein